MIAGDWQVATAMFDSQTAPALGVVHWGSCMNAEALVATAMFDSENALQFVVERLVTPCHVTKSVQVAVWATDCERLLAMVRVRVPEVSQCVVIPRVET